MCESPCFTSDIIHVRHNPRAPQMPLPTVSVASPGDSRMGCPWFTSSASVMVATSAKAWP